MDSTTTNYDDFYYKKVRLRGENWTQEEKDLLFKIMQTSAPIVDNKATDTNTNKRKRLEWLKIQKKLKALTGKPRDIAQLKGIWRRSKKLGINVSLEGADGEQPLPTPPSPLSPPESSQVHEQWPTDNIKQENISVSEEAPQPAGLDEAPKNEDKHEDSDSTEDPLGAQFIQVEIEEIEEPPVKVPRYSNGEEHKHGGNNNSCKALKLEKKIRVKKATQVIEKDVELKIKYQEQELAHQKLRHKIELELLYLDKQKKYLEIELLKKRISKE